MPRTVNITGTTGASPVNRRSVASRGGDDKPRRTVRTSGSSSFRKPSGTPEERESRVRETLDRKPSRAGFSAYKKATQERSQKTNDFKVDDETEVIAFLEDEPFAHYFVHWINTSEGRRPRNCIGDECPLCERGDRAKPVLLFNVVDMQMPEKVLLWKASADPAKRIEKRYDDLTKKNLSLNSPGVYFEVSKFEKDNGFSEYVVDRIRDDALTDEWKIQPLSEDDREELLARAYDESIVEYNTREELQDFADEHMATD